MLWWARLRQAGVSADVEQQFFAWLQASPVHVEEYLRVASDAPSLPSPVTEAAEPAAQAEPNSNASRTPARRVWVRPVLWGAVGGILLSALWIFHYPRGAEAPIHSPERLLLTHHGELRSWTLEDGSVVQLGPESAAVEQYTVTERLIQLRSGHADFHVAKGDRRRFRVVTQDASVVATGTRFDVNLDEKRDVVTLIEGRVMVYAKAVEGEESNKPEASAAQPLVPGEQVSISAGWVSSPARVDLRHIEAWKRGQIIADGMPLAAVVREFNRYADQPIRIENGSLASTRLSGVFSARDATSFLAFLNAGLGVEGIHDARGILLRMREPKAPVPTTEVE